MSDIASTSLSPLNVGMPSLRGESTEHEHRTWCLRVHWC